MSRSHSLILYQRHWVKLITVWDTVNLHKSNFQKMVPPETKELNLFNARGSLAKPFSKT
jgi:hypothetical protein